MIKTGIDGADDSTISVNREKKTLEISSKNWSELTEQTFSYNLEGYTGRYGMSLEFLLAIHIATMTSDLTEEMITNENLQTEVNIESKKDEYIAEYDITYNGEQLPFYFGNEDTYDDLYPLIEDYVLMDEDGNCYVEIPDNEKEEIAKNVTITSLRGWIENFINDGMLYDYSASALEAKEALLSDGTFRVIRKYARYDPSKEYSTIPWTNYFGMVSYSNNYEDYLYGRADSYKNKYSTRLESYNSYIGKEDDETWMLDDMDSTTGDGVGGTIIYESNNKTLAQTYKKSNIGSNGASYVVNVLVHDEREYTDEEYNEVLTNVDYVANVMHGIGYYKKNPDALRYESDYKSLIAILSQIDAYLYLNKLDAYTDVSFTKAKHPNDQNTSADYVLPQIEINIENGLYDKDTWYNHTEYYLLLTKEWLDFLDDGNGNLSLSNKSREDIIKKLEELENHINEYFFVLNNRDEHINKAINSLFKELESELKSDISLTTDEINIIYNALSEQSEQVEFVFPRIKNVIKHWYKDIIFEDEDLGISSSYKTTTGKIEIPAKGISTPGLEVKVVLSNGKNYEQTSQPYVVKGDVVTVDGEIVENTGLENATIEDSNGDTYTLGDGYRTTKKLFTQGKYYVYDGTTETAKSIAYAKELEELGTSDDAYTFAKLYVRSGRITVFAKLSDENAKIEFGEGYNWDTGEWNESTQTIHEDRKNENLGDTVIEAEDGSWSVFLTSASVNRDTNQPVNTYYVKVNKSLAYKSPADNSVEETNKSVERINGLLSAMGVITQRKEISFDNVTASGDVTTLTAFSILEGMHTEDADLIYRDLKEFLIELGYYTKAEFEYLSTNVLTWFIPDYIPEDPNNWPDNTEEDALNYGVMLYPEVVDEENGDVIQEGFKPDLEIIAPGNSKIVDYTSDSITLEFDGISQPEIGVLNGYTMIISGIKVVEEIVAPEADDENVSAVSIETIKEDGTVIDVKTVIGYTSTEKIQIILKNNKGAYLSNVQDYMKYITESELGNIIMLDVDTEEIIEMVWQLEGVSDADPNDGDYYTVCNPEADSPTVGHGVTPATIDTWEELGYYGYVSNGKFLQKTIPKEIVDNVSKMVIQKDLTYLDSLLDKYGVTWGGNQKAAWASLYYNGWHPIVESMVKDWANGDYESVRKKWLESCVSTSELYKKGHQNRRAQEWIVFNTGELLSKPEAYKKCYETKEY